MDCPHATSKFWVSCETQVWILYEILWASSPGSLHHVRYQVRAYPTPTKNSSVTLTVLGGSGALGWIPARRLKLEQLFKCPLDPEEAPTSFPGQMMRELILHYCHSFSLALFNNLFWLNIHRVDQQASCLKRLLSGEWMKGRSLLQEPPHFTGVYSGSFGS